MRKEFWAIWRVSNLERFPWWWCRSSSTSAYAILPVMSRFSRLSLRNFLWLFRKRWRCSPRHRMNTNHRCSKCGNMALLANASKKSSVKSQSLRNESSSFRNCLHCARKFEALICHFWGSVGSQSVKTDDHGLSTLFWCNFKLRLDYYLLMSKIDRSFRY